METLKGKIVWIVGASSGFGEALAYEFANNGAKLILSARRKSELERVKQNIKEASVLPFDVLQFSDFLSVTRSATDLYGRVDILVLNAAVAQNASAIDTGMEVQRMIMDIDFFSYTELARCILPHMTENGAGRIVVIGGLLARLGLPNRSSYSAAKAALHGYFNCLRTEVASCNIGVTILEPGALNTDLASKAIGADGTIQGKEGVSVGCDLHIAASQSVAAIAAGKHEAYIGEEDKSYELYKLAGTDPDMVAALLLKRFGR